MFYLATSMYKTNVKHSEKDESKQKRNQDLAKFLEENGIEIFLPQRDADQTLPGKQLLERELEAIKNCEAMIAVLSDTRGIYLEAGYAKALGKKIIALKVEETRELSEWGKAFFNHVADDQEDLIGIIKSREWARSPNKYK
jgi:nucleoside 2-deoxyribosyltransferase